MCGYITQMAIYEEIMDTIWRCGFDSFIKQNCIKNKDVTDSAIP
jgi:hypothetical protein